MSFGSHPESPSKPMDRSPICEEGFTEASSSHSCGVPRLGSQVSDMMDAGGRRVETEEHGMQMGGQPVNGQNDGPDARWRAGRDNGTRLAWLW